MPVYEWHCRRCEISFEALTRLSERSRTRECPRCGQPARRVISRVAIGSRCGGAAASAGGDAGDSEWAAYRLPPADRFCWMDDKAAERLGAYQAGRGTEYDEKQAMKAEARQRRGEPEPPKPRLAEADVRGSQQRRSSGHPHRRSGDKQRPSPKAAVLASKPKP